MSPFLSRNLIFGLFSPSCAPIAPFVRTIPFRFVFVDIAHILSRCPPSLPPASHLRRHHHLFLSVSHSRLSWTHSPNTLNLLQASVGSPCVQTMPFALVKWMQAPIPFLLLCIQIFSLRYLPLFFNTARSLLPTAFFFSHRRFSPDSALCSRTVVRIFARSLKIVVRTLSSPPCSLSLVKHNPNTSQTIELTPERRYLTMG